MGWNKLKDKKTKLGVTLAHCIKTGVDNPGHPMIKTCGIVAGDEESYELFKELFDPIISSRHGGYAPDAKHPTDLDVNKLSDAKIDPTGKYVLTSRCRTGRSVRGFRLPPTCSFEERREIEKVVVNGLLSLDGELKGDYFPLHGSRSYAPKPNGMTLEKEEELRSAGNLFQEPDSTLLLSGGMGRHWPDARGIFHNDQKNLFVWLNEEDHMRIVSMQGKKGTCTKEGKDMRAVAKRFMDACNTIEGLGLKFMKSEALGWILTCPSNCGTGLRAGCQVDCEHLYRHLTNGGKKIESGAGENPGAWKGAMKGMALQARGTGGVDDTSVTVFDISNADRMGKTDVTLVNICIDGIAFLTVAEHALRKDYEGNKATVDEALALAQKPVEGKDGNEQLKVARALLLEKIPTLADDFAEA